MNAQAREFGMTGTDYTDPTGLAASTVSTMADQLKLAEAVQSVPVLTSIAAETSAQIPVAGTVRNVNRDLGFLGIDGIKTGTTAAAGSCLLFSAHVTVGGRRLTLLGIVLGMPGSSGTPWNALKAAVLLVETAEAALGTATVAAPGSAVASIEQNGATLVRLGVAAPLTVVGWPGLGYRVSVTGGDSSPRLVVTRTGGSCAPFSAALTELPAKTAASGMSSTPAQTATPASP
jgi:D-alanyl-D-alanine carboxypeptidase (penicillin-binding protein 5/6)